MRVNVWWLVAIIMTALTACDEYTYKGRDGEESLAIANSMSLPDAYSFYVEAYKGTSPPMLDVAKTFRRFGSQGTRYLTERALRTGDKEEFDAAATALLILDYPCSADIAEALETKRSQLGAEVSGC